MIFQKSARKPKHLEFNYQNQLVEIVQEYTYLGIKLTPTGNFTIAQKSLCDKALRAMFKIQKYTSISKLLYRLAFRIFDSVILPILTYGGEIWGTPKNASFRKWDQSPSEKVHLKFCKMYLELNRKALNTIAKQAFLIAKELDLENRKSYISEIKSYLRETESKNHKTLEPLSNSSIAQALKNIENNYLKFWQGEITASKKLDFYRKFKQDFSVSSYIDILRNRGTRKSFVKFYLSNHKLCIESGRHRRPVLQRKERVCAVCKNNEIEDETHMLFSCALYNTLREQFLIKQQHILNTAFDNYDYWLNILFTTESKASIRTTARYISQCFLLRDAASSN